MLNDPAGVPARQSHDAIDHQCLIEGQRFGMPNFSGKAEERILFLTEMSQPYSLYLT